MKLTSIITVWADCLCLLPHCLNNHLKFCDEILVIWSQHSRHGERNDSVLEYIAANGHDQRVKYHQLEPMRGFSPLQNETRSRNHGIDLARKSGASHILIADADEFYAPNGMLSCLQSFREDKKLNGFVHRIRVYIKTPTLYTTDHTLVPGIHQLMPNTQCGPFKFYPYAYDQKLVPHIDPSRRFNFFNGIQMSDYYMHHMSYVRSDIDLKIDNSSANLRRSRQTIYNELREAKAGRMSELYHKPLQECENHFNIVL